MVPARPQRVPKVPRRMRGRREPSSFCLVEVVRLFEINYTVLITQLMLVEVAILRLDEPEVRINSFATFYTLRWLWKESKQPVPELYKTLGCTRSFYDNVLRGVDQDIYPRAKRMSELTGIDEKYFTGKAQLTVGVISDSIWKNYIDLREQNEGNQSKNAALIKAEGVIAKALRSARKNNSGSEAYRYLVHFAKYRNKWTAKDTQECLEEIERIIQRLKRSELEQVEQTELQRYKEMLRQHYDRVAAILILKDWNSPENKNEKN